MPNDTATTDNGERAIAPIDRSLQAEASSAHARINIPLNLDNWREVPAPIQDDLLWFHQWILSNNIGWKEAEDATGYNNNTLFKVLKGTYEGSWPNVSKSIRSFRDLQSKRESIQKHFFVENSIAEIVFAALDYALANQSFTIIVGRSRVGKSTAAKEWQLRNNHGRSVYVSCPAVGGTKGFLRRIASQVGVNRSQAMSDMADAIHRSFNKNRILIIDQAHWLLPADPRTANPGGLNFLQDLHDEKGCAIALLSTRRLAEAFKFDGKQAAYQYEQIVGRTGQPWLIPSKIKRKDIVPIVAQFIARPNESLLNAMQELADGMGGLGELVHTLQAASRIAHKKHERLSDAHVEKAIAFRQRMSGERS